MNGEFGLDHPKLANICVVLLEGLKLRGALHSAVRRRASCKQVDQLANHCALIKIEITRIFRAKEIDLACTLPYMGRATQLDTNLTTVDRIGLGRPNLRLAKCIFFLLGC